MKVYVMLKWKPFGVEEFVDVKLSQKSAIKAFRTQYPHMRGTVAENNLSSDANNTYLLAIREVEAD